MPSFSRSAASRSSWRSRSRTSESPTSRAGSLGANLSWDFQRRGETADEFVRRVNDHGRPAGQARPVPAEAWLWVVGPESRGRGTVQADRLRTDAASLAGDKHIAIWPTKGWWADHVHTRGDARIAYSLVVHN